MRPMHPLTRYRRDHKPPLSKADLARALGVSRGYLLRIEAGERQVGIDMLSRTVAATGLPATVLRPDLKQFLERPE